MNVFHSDECKDFIDADEDFEENVVGIFVPIYILIRIVRLSKFLFNLMCFGNINHIIDDSFDYCLDIIFVCYCR